MLWALKQAPDVPAQCVAVLFGLAEAADKHGRSAYPSAATLSAYARKSERQVRYDLSLLADAKLIRLGDQRHAAKLPYGRRPVVYDLALERLRLPGVQPVAPLEGVESTPPVQPPAPVQPIAPLDDADLLKLDDLQPIAPVANEIQGCNTAQPGVQSTADKPSGNRKSRTSSRRKSLNDGREDVERLCAHLAARIEGNGSLRPEIGKKWRDAARLMLDTEHRTEEQIHKAIDWCQDDSFWCSNVMSMPKLRKQYDVLRLRALAQKKAQANGHVDKRQEATDGLFDRAAQRIAAREAGR